MSQILRQKGNSKLLLERWILFPSTRPLQKASHVTAAGSHSMPHVVLLLCLPSHQYDLGLQQRCWLLVGTRGGGAVAGQRWQHRQIRVWSRSRAETLVQSQLKEFPVNLHDFTGFWREYGHIKNKLKCSCLRQGLTWFSPNQQKTLKGQFPWFFTLKSWWVRMCMKGKLYKVFVAWLKRQVGVRKKWVHQTFLSHSPSPLEASGYSAPGWVK